MFSAKLGQSLIVVEIIEAGGKLLGEDYCGSDVTIKTKKKADEKKRQEEPIFATPELSVQPELKAFQYAKPICNMSRLSPWRLLLLS